MKMRLRAAFLLCLLGVLVTAAFAPARRAYTERQTLGDEREALGRLNAQRAELRLQLELLKDPGYLETLAREHLGMVRPGEIAYVVVPP